MKIIEQKFNLRVVEMNGVYYYQKYLPILKGQVQGWITNYETKYKGSAIARLRLMM